VPGIASGQNHHERPQRHDRGEQPEAEAERAGREDPQVLGDPLVGVVRRAVVEREPVVGSVVEPVADEPPRQPGSPAHLEHLGEVQPVDRADDVDRSQEAELEEQRRERREVALLEHLVELPVPLVEQDQDVDAAERERDDHRQQHPGAPPLLRAPVDGDQPPGAPDERAHAKQRAYPSMPLITP
jgi:hypothetical protein